MNATLTFLGASRTVTGSKYLVEASGRRVLLDCGLFQGSKPLRLRNWEAPPFDSGSLDAVVLSHAHLDHSGFLPLLVKRGYRGPIFCTGGTADLLAIVLPDSAHIQQEDAERANRFKYSKHTPALPLYTIEDANQTLRLLSSQAYHERFDAAPGIGVVLRRAGHILGSATVEVTIEKPSPVRLVFSGDLGRWDRPILRDPEFVPQADVLLIEATYGDRVHSTDTEQSLANVINETAHHEGVIIVPTFAIGRTQELIWTMRKLEEENRIPAIPVFIDSPMAINVSSLYCRHPEDHDLDMETLMDERRCPLCCREYHLVRTAEESKQLADRHGPRVIVAGSGMLTGGRVLHHLKLYLPDHRNTVLLAGYQANGTRGRALQEGARTVRIHGQDVQVRARVATIDGLSAHADRNEILRWLRGFEQPPSHTFIVHGEPKPAESLAETVRSELGWTVSVATDGATVPLARNTTTPGPR